MSQVLHHSKHMKQVHIIPVLMHSETCSNSSFGLQMAITPAQPLTTSKYCLQTSSGMEQCQDSTVYREHLNMNNKTNEKVSKPWVVHNTLSQLQDRGNLSVSQQLTHLEMHITSPHSPKMAVPSILNQTTHDSHLQTCG